MKQVPLLFWLLGLIIIGLLGIDYITRSPGPRSVTIDRALSTNCWSNNGRLYQEQYYQLEGLQQQGVFYCGVVDSCGANCSKVLEGTVWVVPGFEHLQHYLMLSAQRSLSLAESLVLSSTVAAAAVMLYLMVSSWFNN